MQYFLNGLLTITAAMWGATGAMCVILLYVILLDRANEEPCFSPPAAGSSRAGAWRAYCPPAPPSPPYSFSTNRKRVSRRFS